MFFLQLCITMVAYIVSIHFYLDGKTENAVIAFVVGVLMTVVIIAMYSKKRKRGKRREYSKFDCLDCLECADAGNCDLPDCNC